MNFSQDESGEVQRLKKQQVQDGLLLSQMRQAKAKADNDVAELQSKVKSLQSSVDDTAARLDNAERREHEAREDRDRMKFANANLEQALQRSNAQLQQRERNRRMDDATRDDAQGRRERELLSDNEKLEQRCSTLQAQLREAQNNSHAQAGPSSLSSSSSASRIHVLESEITHLKSELERQRSETSNSVTSDSPRTQKRRARRSSGVNVTGTDEQQLREINSELTERVEAAEAKSSRAEREALKASNERLASERRNQSRLDALTSELDDLKDEVKMRESHIDELERERNGVDILLRDVKSSRQEDTESAEARIRHLKAIAQDANAARRIFESSDMACALSRPKDDAKEAIALADIASALTKAAMQSESKVVAVEKKLQATEQEVQSLREQAKVLDVTSQTLQKREKELAMAKSRLKKLSILLRKALPSSAGLSSMVGGAGDASMSMAVGEETTVGDVTFGMRGFEADMIDEMEQLLSFVEELDNRIEFNRVENQMRESSASMERDEFKNKVASLEAQLSEADRVCKMREQTHQVDLQKLQAELEQRIAAQETELNRAIGEHELVQSQLKAMHDTLLNEKNGLQDQHQEAVLRAEEQLKMQADVAAQTESHLHGLLDRYQDALARETEQWQVFVEENADIAFSATSRMQSKLTSLSSLHKTTSAQLEHANRRAEAAQINVDTLQHNVDVLQGRVQRRNDQIEAYKIDLEQVRTNWRLAEDALNEFLPHRDTDVTVLSNAGDKETQTRPEPRTSEPHVQLEDVQRQLKQSISDRDETLSELEQLKQKHKDAVAVSEQLRNNVEALQEGQKEEVHQLQGMIDDLRAEALQYIENLEEIKSSRRNLEERVQALSVGLGTANAEVQTLPETDCDSEKRFTELQDMTNVLLSGREEMQAECSMLRTRQQQLMEQVEQLESVLAETREEHAHAMSSSESEKEQHVARQASLEGRKAELENDAIAKADLIATLQDEVAASTNVIAELEAKLTKLRNEGQENEEDLMHRIGQLEDELKAAYIQNDVEGELQQRIQRSEEELVVKEKHLKEVRLQEEALRQELQTIRDELSTERLNFAAKQEEFVAELQANQRLVESLRLELHDSQQALQHIESIQESSKAQMEDLHAKKSASESEVRRLMKALAQHEAQKDHSARIVEFEQSIALLKGTIEQLEQELTLKAQECEDADDKELALRKDNKRLVARIAQLQSRLDKQQSQPAAARGPISRPVPISAPQSDTLMRADQEAAAAAAQATQQQQSGATRKRRTREEDDQDEQPKAGVTGSKPSSGQVDRACIFAPAPSSLTSAASKSSTRTPKMPAQRSTSNSRDNSVKSDPFTPRRAPIVTTTSSDSTTKEHDVFSSATSDTTTHNNAGTNGQSRSNGGSGTKPSDLVALRLQQKLTAATAAAPNASSLEVSTTTFKDRTNKPRDVHAHAHPLSSSLATVHRDTAKLPSLSINNTSKSSAIGGGGGGGTGDNHFMAKLNRFRPNPTPTASSAASAIGNGNAVNSSSATTIGTAQRIVR